MPKFSHTSQTITSVSLADYVKMIRRQWVTVLIVFLVVTMIGAYLVNKRASTYIATAKILIEPPISTSTGDNSTTPLSNVISNGERYSVETHAQLLNNDSLKQDVAAELNATASPDGSTISKGRDSVKFDVSTPDKTEFLVVTGTSSSARLASDAVNSLVGHYLSLVNSLKAKELDEAKQTLVQKAELAQVNLTNERKIQEQLTEKFGAPELAKSLEPELGHLSELRIKTETSKSELQALDATYRSLAAELLTTPRIENAVPVAAADADVQAAQTKLESLQVEKAGLLQRYTEDHPSVIAINGQIAELQSAISDRKIVYGEKNQRFNPDRRDLKNRLELTESQLRGKEAEFDQLQSSVAALEAKVNKYPGFSVKMAQSNLEVSVAEDQVEQYQKLLDQIALRTSTLLPEARSISRAGVPPASNGPGKSTMLLLVSLVALMAGALAGILRELNDDRIKAGSFDQYIENTPLLGFFTSPKSKIHKHVKPSLLEGRNVLARLGLASMPATSERIILVFLREEMNLPSVVSTFARAGASLGHLIAIQLAHGTDEAADQRRDSITRDLSRIFGDGMSINSGYSTTYRQALVSVPRVVGSEDPFATQIVSSGKLVVVVAPPLIDLAGISRLVTPSDKLILIVPYGATTRTEIAEALIELNAVDVEVSGLILVDPELRDSGISNSSPAFDNDVQARQNGAVIHLITNS